MFLIGFCPWILYVRCIPIDIYVQCGTFGNGRADEITIHPHSISVIKRQPEHPTEHGATFFCILSDFWCLPRTNPTVLCAAVNFRQSKDSHWHVSCYIVSLSPLFVVLHLPRGFSKPSFWHLHPIECNSQPSKQLSCLPACLPALSSQANRLCRNGLASWS